MIPRCVALLCLPLICPAKLALAAPASDSPPIQRPSAAPSTEEQSQRSEQGEDPAGEQKVVEDTDPTQASESPSPAPADAETLVPTTPEAESEATGEATAEDETTTTANVQPSAAGEADPDSTPAPAPSEGEDLSHLLDSDEADASPRVRVSPSTPERVDRSERLRNYYASVYRPDHNPARIYFAARAAVALSGTSENVGGGRMAFVNAELGQTWNHVGYGINAALYAGGLTFGADGTEKFAGIMVGGGPSLSLGRLSLLGRGYLDLRAGYNFFYAPVASTREGMADPPDAAPHGPKLQLDAGLLFHGSEQRRFRHGIGVSVGWQLMVHSFSGEFPVVNTFNLGVSYFFG